ncbi:MAG: YceI family protein [Flavobacteriaceae bacterium]|nr:YceI family protein [Flavobacteriaceae bacterium]
MKKFLLLICIATLTFTSCKKEEKPSEPGIEETAPVKKFVVDASSSSVGWTAYKTTAKTPVKGKFTQLKIDNPLESATIQGALQGLSFEIPVSSFFSNDDIRDNKIKSLFFGIMKDTSILSGTFKKMEGNDKQGKVTLTLTMNQVAHDVEMDYTIDGNKINISGNIMMMDWNLQEAYESIHKACELLHTGEDGISKTWKEVAIEGVAVVKEK